MKFQFREILYPGAAILWAFALLFALAGLVPVYGQSCDHLTLSDGVVCRCTATYCDEIQPHPEVTADNVIVYTSSEAGDRLELSVHDIPASPSIPSGAIPIALDGSSHQKMIGFGGAFTDATAYVVGQLPSGAQDKFISTYFSRNGGSRYSVGRVPVGSADFSRTSYSLVDDNDISLASFALKDDNLVPGQDYKLDMILKAQEEVEQTSEELDEDLKLLQIYASIWSAPVWMKTCDRPPAISGINECGSGFYPWLYGRPKTPDYVFGGLDDDTSIRTAYANYWLKFIQAYEARGVNLWGMTAQNEPSGNPVGNSWENTNWRSDDLTNFVVNKLGPLIKQHYPDFKIMTDDDQYPELAEYAQLANGKPIIDGIGYHWYFSMSGGALYTGDLVGQLVGGQIAVSNAYNTYNMDNKNGHKFLMMTEACTGYLDSSHVRLGSWERGINYMTSILHEVESGAAGWVDWNLALDMEGGPNHAANFVDSPIIVNAAAQEFYKQPMYYSLAHFSAFVPPNAIRLGVANAVQGYIGSNRALEVIAFRKNETSTECILVLINDHLPASLPVRGLSDDHTVVITLPGSGKQFVLEMEDNTFKTVLFHCPIFQNTFEGISQTSNEPKEAMTIGVGSAAALLGVAAVLGLGFFTVKKRVNKIEVAEKKSMVPHYVEGQVDLEENDEVVPERKPTL